MENIWGAATRPEKEAKTDEAGSRNISERQQLRGEVRSWKAIEHTLQEQADADFEYQPVKRNETACQSEAKSNLQKTPRAWRRNQIADVTGSKADNSI